MRKGKRPAPALPSPAMLLETLPGALLEIRRAVLRSERAGRGNERPGGWGGAGRRAALCREAQPEPPAALPCPAPQAIATREELHARHARSLQDKDALRKRVRELSEKVDELQLQLFQREGQLLAVEGRLRWQQLETSVLVGLPRGLYGVPQSEPWLCHGGALGVRPHGGRCVPRDCRPRRRSRQRAWAWPGSATALPLARRVPRRS